MIDLPEQFDIKEGETSKFVFELNKASIQDVTFHWSVQHSSTSASDFTGMITGSQSIIAGSTTTDISIGTSNDSIYEGDESFSVNITNIRGASPSSLSASGSIIDNDTQPSITFEQVASAATEGGSFSYTLRLTNISTTDVNFHWSVQHQSTSISDLTGDRSGLETISAGDTTATITLRINDDNLLEPAENFTLSITNITGAIPDSLEASITILASDVDNNGNGLIDLSTQENLDNIRYNLAGTSYKTSASDASKDCGGNACRGYELLNNITLNPNWKPIGSEAKPFTSILQGNGYSITNLVIDGGNNLGLFAELSGAMIDNLVVEVVSIAGDDNVGTLAGNAENSTISRLHIRAASTSSKLQAGANIGGILGKITDATITNVTSDLSIVGGANVGGIAGYVLRSAISYATSSGSITNSESGNSNYGGLVGLVEHNSTISYSSASGSVTSSGNNNRHYGGLVGDMRSNSAISYSSASGSVTSSGEGNNNYGGLVGSSAGEIMHSWSSSSVFESAAAGLVGNNTGNLGFSYALGNASYGLVATNTGTITNSYWNSETSGALAAATADVVGTNIASSDTESMLTATGSAGARIFKGFSDATDELGNSIWSFADDSYPVIRQLGLDKQAVALAYGLLRLAHPTTTGGVSSFLGGTLNHEAIALDVVDYSTSNTLAILDINLLASNNGCSIENSDNSLVSNSANSTKVKLIVNLAKTSSNLHRRIVYQDCNIAFDNAAVLQAGNRLQLAATITKGSASLTKNFIINFR